jgi:hypothetical protein
MNDTSALHGALLPVVRQVVQNLAGVLLGAGILNENEITAIAGLVMSAVTVAWMLIARARAAKVEGAK